MRLNLYASNCVLMAAIGQAATFEPTTSTGMADDWNNDLA